MTQHDNPLADSVGRLFRDALERSPSGTAALSPSGFAESLWSQVQELGLPALLVREELGGVGASWEEACAVLEAAGRFNVPLPLGEAMLAARLTLDAGLDPPPGLLSVAADCRGRLWRDGDGWRFKGRLNAVPWGRHCAAVVTCLEHQGSPHVLLLPRAEATLRTGHNLAEEPRDDLIYEADAQGVALQAAPCTAPEAAQLLEYCALLRVAQISGALQAALARSVEYAQQRRQFGKAIGQFQAVQQQLAQMGCEVAAASCAAHAAGRAAGAGDAGFAIAAAKLRANQAIGLVSACAHQVHGAIGFTAEYALRHSTQRLWSWRSEYGNDRYWGERLGRLVAARGAEHFWSDLTERDDLVGAAA